MNRLTDKKVLANFKAIKNISPDYVASNVELIYEKLGKLEDLMAKYEIETPEALEEILKDYDDMAKAIVEFGIGTPIRVREDKSE